MKRLGSLVFFVFLCSTAFAAGPLNVAGTSGFGSGLAGTPITWANGQVDYYTDQGDLSPLLPGATADQFVADAFARWTSISTAALRANRAGSLDENVDGTSVSLLSGSLTFPADVQPGSAKPLAIVYDADGRVMDALLGLGAGAPELCATNSIYAESDRYSEDAHIAHAKVIINGNCAKTSAQLPILKYRLVRALGRVLGLDYSQLNDNVVFGTPPPGVDDYAGFPVMHPLAVLCTEANCLANADIPRMDDRAAISKLYPVTATSASGFPGKAIFKDTTGRIHGSVRFPAWKGTPGQGMQGVNVVARMVDPVTGRVSRSYAASSVSGFLFRGNAGNPMTGYTDILLKRFDTWGSGDSAVEGYFDLAGLEFPAGYTSVTYEVSVEPVNALYADSTAVGPYRRGPVAPAGTATAFRITVTRGQEVSQDINMQGASSERQDQYEPDGFLSPTPVPASGNWLGSLSGYGDLDYLYFTVGANRTFTFDVKAIDAEGFPTDKKAQPVLGVWNWGDAEEQPRVTESYFNSALPATTRLQAEVIASGDYKIAIGDYRGDGRPDYRYEAHLLYADEIAPGRASVKGGTTVSISGIGFTSNMRVQIGSLMIVPTLVGANQLVFRTPALADGSYSVTVIDLATNATTVMENALRVGSADTRIVLLGGSNPQVPVGTQAPNPIRIRVIDIYNGDPVEGATVNFTADEGSAIEGCSQSVCPVITDQSGAASVYVLVKAEGARLIQATLPTGGSTAASVNGVAVPLEITLDQPVMYVASGTSATLPITATVVGSGVPLQGRTVNFLLNSGSAVLSPESSVTDSKGVAAGSVSVSAISRDVNISACVAPDNASCRTFVLHPVNNDGLRIQRISGDQQLINVGENFAPLSLRVVDANANSVSGVPVQFLVDVYRAENQTVRVVSGDSVTFTRDEPVMLSTLLVTVFSDSNGMVTLPIANTQEQPVRVVVTAHAGDAELALVLSSMWNPDGTAVIPSTVQVRSSQISEPAAAPFNKRRKEPREVFRKRGIGSE